MCKQTVDRKRSQYIGRGRFCCISFFFNTWECKTGYFMWNVCLHNGCLLINFTNGLDQVQAQKIFGPDLDPNCSSSTFSNIYSWNNCVKWTPNFIWRLLLVIKWVCWKQFCWSHDQDGCHAHIWYKK